MKFSFDTFRFIDTGIDENKLAFACSNGDLSWAALAAAADDCISFFKNNHLPEGRPVVIYGHKEKEFPTLIVACLQANIPYIPVDETVPLERLEAIVSQTSPSAIFNLTGRNLDFVKNPDQKNNNGITWINLVQQPVLYSDANTAYLIFTSGSTGVPKGVVIPKKALKSFTGWLVEDYPLDADTVFVNQAPFSFDLSLVELMGNLALGSSTILNTNTIAKNPDLLFERLRQYKATVWHSTPSFALLCSTSTGFSQEQLPHIKTFLFIGEELTSRVVQRVRAAFPSAGIYNAYGPSEATYAVTICEITSNIQTEFSASLPVGFPKKDSGVCIYDGQQILETASAQEGEIILSGQNLATGYLNPVLTAEKFRNINGTRYYFTGDYGFYRNGLLFFNGRRDEQVKLNGFRIELGEINEVLSQAELADECVTLPLKSGNQVKRIVSFVKPKAGAGADVVKNNCTERATQKLPAYMVPSEIIVLDDFPYNSNLKIDKNKLLDMYMNGSFA